MANIKSAKKRILVAKARNERKQSCEIRCKDSYEKGRGLQLLLMTRLLLTPLY